METSDENVSEKIGRRLSVQESAPDFHCFFVVSWGEFFSRRFSSQRPDGARGAEVGPGAATEGGIKIVDIFSLIFSPIFSRSDWRRTRRAFVRFLHGVAKGYLR